MEELFHYLVAYKMKWQDRGFDTPLLNKTLFRRIRYFLGGKVRVMLSGGAPLAADTHSLCRTCLSMPLIQVQSQCHSVTMSQSHSIRVSQFYSVRLFCLQGYGLTETASCATVTHVRDRKTGRAGAPLMDVDIKLVNWDEGNYRVTDQPNPRGEIHVGGDNVAVGYFKNEKETAANFYEENGRRWFRTGDIGEFEQDGVLKIIDRKKDLVKLQHGEYVSYGKTESVLKTAPIVENICAYANPDRDFIIAILIPDKNQLKALNTELSLNEACKDVEVKKQVCSLLKD